MSDTKNHEYRLWQEASDTAQAGILKYLFAPAFQIKESQNASWQQASAHQGDNLAKLFRRNKIAFRNLLLLIESGPSPHRLEQIYPGTRFFFKLGDGGTLDALIYQPNLLEIYEYTRVGSSFRMRHAERIPEVRPMAHKGIIKSSLYGTGRAIGLPSGIIIKLAKIFQWDIDFTSDVRLGDSFSILLEHHYVDDKNVGYGNILAAKLIVQNQQHSAIQYKDQNGYAAYFSPDGKALRTAFLRAPLVFNRISSPFNMERIHPIWKSAKPHRGIDYVAPTGTHVLASGSGWVKILIRNHQASGNYLVLQHGQRYQTKYLHLSRFAEGIEEGSTVRQGDVIGYVGATGWATGAHLHYEFLLDGTHRDPGSIPLPRDEPVPMYELPTFQELAKMRFRMLREVPSPSISGFISGQ